MNRNDYAELCSTCLGPSHSQTPRSHSITSPSVQPPRDQKGTETESIQTVRCGSERLGILTKNQENEVVEVQEGYGGTVGCDMTKVDKS